jgi:hypothetical protein
MATCAEPRMTWTWIVLCSADSLRNDNELKQRDEAYRRWKQRQESVVVP